MILTQTEKRIQRDIQTLSF